MTKMVRYFTAHLMLVLGFCLLIAETVSAAPAQSSPKVNSADEKLLREVWDRLMLAFEVERPEGFDIWPPVLDPVDPVDDINAYATCRETEDGKNEPYVTVLNGWLKLIGQRDPDRLAFVLGHELGHHVHRHTLRKDLPEGTITLRAFTREQEQEADKFGAQLLLKAGYSMRGAIDSWKRFSELDIDYSSFEGKGTTHPSWTERMKLIDQGDRAPLWDSMIAFRNGVFLLQVEQYALAERCFLQVTKEFPDCYEAWANLGFARLMQYCDAMEIEDLRHRNQGQLALGAFYSRPQSLEHRFRGIDEELWFNAVGALRQALILKDDLVVPKINLGLAYMLSPQGPQVGQAEQYFEAALKQASESDSVDPTARLAALINAAVADLAAGRLDQSSQRLEDASRTAASGPTLSTVPVPHFLSMAIDYNKAMLLAASKGEQGRRNAVELLQRNYLTQADPSSAWWTLAYEQYEKLCNELKITPKPKEELQRRRSALWRPVTAVTLGSGKTIDIVQDLDKVIAELGETPRIPVTKGTRLDKFSYPDLGVELLATSDLLVIRVMGDDEATVELRGTGLGTARHVLRMGMPKAELEKLVEKHFPAQGLTVKHSLRLDGIDAVYRWYPALGLAVLIKNDKVAELVIVPVSRA